MVEAADGHAGTDACGEATREDPLAPTLQVGAHRAVAQRLQQLELAAARLDHHRQSRSTRVRARTSSAAPEIPILAPRATGIGSVSVSSRATAGSTRAGTDGDLSLPPSPTSSPI